MFGGTDKPRLSVVAPGSGSVAKKHVDKVSIAGIFNKIFAILSAVETLVRLVPPEMPCGTGLRKGGDSHNRGYWQS